MENFIIQIKKAKFPKALEELLIDIAEYDECKDTSCFFDTLHDNDELIEQAICKAIDNVK